MTGDVIFFRLTIALCAAAFVTNGGWSGRRFGRLKNWDTADKLLFLAWGMLLCGACAMREAVVR